MLPRFRGPCASGDDVCDTSFSTSDVKVKALCAVAIDKKKRKKKDRIARLNMIEGVTTKAAAFRSAQLLPVKWTSKGAEILIWREQTRWVQKSSSH